MKTTHETKQLAGAVDLQYVLVLGMKVLVKAHTHGKLEASWEGSWTVLQLMGSADSAVEVFTDNYKARVVAVANVKPYQGDEPVSVTKQPWTDEDWIGKYEGTGGDKWDISDSDDGWLTEDG